MALKALLAAVFGLLALPLAQGFVTPRPAGLAYRPAVRRLQASTLEMNIAGRFFRLAKANINSLLSRWEDPEKVLDATVDEMQADLIKVRQSYAEVNATQKRLNKQKEQAEATAEEWYKRAQLALSKEDEELAREALTRRQQSLDTAEALAGQLDGQEEAVKRLYDAMTQLESRIQEAKSQKDQLVARARTAKTTTKVSDMLNNVGDGNSVAVFDRMAEKVEAMEAQAEVTLELSGAPDSTLEQKFKALGEGNKVDDELAKLKGSLAGGSQKQLPGKFDDEIEKMKKEMQ
eukprot:scaffold8478_cov286-Pinguiococcus_pyrenoidosus.AAC.7